MIWQSLFKTCHYIPFFLLHIHFLTWLAACLHTGGPVELQKTTSHCMFAVKINIGDLQRSVCERRERLVQLTLILSRGGQHQENLYKNGVFCRIREFPVDICTTVIVFAGNLCRVYILSWFGGACKENSVECISQLPISLWENVNLPAEQLAFVLLYTKMLHAVDSKGWTSYRWCWLDGRTVPTIEAVASIKYTTYMVYCLQLLLAL